MPTGQAGSVVWPTDISRQEFNQFRRIGTVLGRFGGFLSDVGVRLTLAEIENEVANAQSITNDKILDQDRLMLTENDEVLDVRNGQPFTKYEDQWNKRFEEIEKLPEGFTHPASRRRFLTWTAANKQRWQLGVETKIQQRRVSRIMADSDKISQMIAVRLNVEDEVQATGRTELEVREGRLRALWEQNVEKGFMEADKVGATVEKYMKLAREAHSTKIENEVLGGALTIRNEDGEVNLTEAHKFIDAEEQLSPEEKIDVKRKLTSAVAQDEAAKFQQWNKIEGEKRDEWYDNLRDGKLSELQTDLDTFDSGMTGKWKSREVALKSDFQTILDRRAKAEAAVQDKWSALEDPFNREIFGEITEARTQSDLDRTAAKIGGYVKNRQMSVQDAKSQQTEIEQRRTQLAAEADDFEAASRLEDRVFDIWTGAEAAEDVRRDLKQARASDEKDVRITDSTYDRLFTLAQNQGKAYQGSAMKEGNRLIDNQLVTISTSAIDSLIAAILDASGEQEIDLNEQLAARRDERKLQQWNASRARRALSGWLTDNTSADSEAIANEALRTMARFDKDPLTLNREAQAERQAFIEEAAIPQRESFILEGGTARFNIPRTQRTALSPEPGTLQRPTTQAEYDAMPSGTRFIDTDGRTVTKG